MTIRCRVCKKILSDEGDGLVEKICTPCVALGKGGMAEATKPASKEPKVACFYQWLDKKPNQKLKLILQSTTEHLKPKEPVSLVLGYQQLKTWYFEMRKLIEQGPPPDEAVGEDNLPQKEE